MVLPLDMPDDYPWLPGSGKSTLGDLGELAARLGSPITYDRRGSIYWYDDFENGLGGFLVDTPGAGGSVRYVSSPVFRGNLSARITTNATANVGTGLLKYSSPSDINNMGLEVTFAGRENIDKFRIYISISHDGIQARGEIMYDVTNSTINYLDENNNYVIVDDLILDMEAIYTFSTVKLVIDPVNSEYIRLMIDRHEYDLSGIGLYVFGTPIVELIESGIHFMPINGLNAVGYVDNVIFTLGEL